MRRQESIAKASLVVLTVTLLSRILGFVREILIANFYGAQAVIDSYLVASVLPLTIAGLIGGALTIVFIPVFIDEREKSGEEAAWDGTNSLITVSLFYLLLMLCLGYVIAPFFIRAIAPGFTQERLRLAISFSVVMMPSLVFSGLLGLFTGIFNSYRLFTLPTLVGLLYNVCLMVFLLIARNHPLLSLGVGSTSAIALQVVILCLVARKMWPLLRMNFLFSHPMLKKVWRLMLPIFVGTGVGYLNLIVDRIFASFLPEGTIAALNFAVRVRDIPLGLFVVALSHVVYPVTSSQVAQGKIEEFKELFARSLETLWLFVIPASVGLLMLPQQTVRVLFERGAFTAQATTTTGQALFFYSLGLFAGGSLDLVAKAFYSLQDTRTPVKIGAIGLIVNTVLNALLVRPFAHRGLALATSLSVTIVFVILIETLRRRMGGIGGRALVKNLMKISLATIIMGIFVSLLRPLAQGTFGYIVVVSLSVAIYTVAVLLLKPRSAQMILNRLKSKLGAD
ncbi:murein biosynthesis integral membrane protein MurJ [Pseudothermotoga sp.]